MFKFLIHFELIFVSGVWSSPSSLFFMLLSIIYWRDYPFAIEYF